MHTPRYEGITSLESESTKEDDCQWEFRLPSAKETLARAKRVEAQAKSTTFLLALGGDSAKVLEFLETHNNVRGSVGDTVRRPSTHAGRLSRRDCDLCACVSASTMPLAAI